MPDTRDVPTDGNLAASAEQPESLLIRTLRTLIAYRRVLTVTIVLAAVVTSAVTLLFLRQNYAVMKVRLAFEGASHGTYPSGVKFSQEDIVDTPLLDRVYREQGMDKILRFDDFRRAVSISPQSTPELISLEAEYRDKLAMLKLTLVERAQLEREYADRRLSLQSGTDYVLTMDLSDPALAGLALQKQASVFGRILAIWSEEAAVRKGAIQYQVSIPSNSIFVSEAVMGEDYLVTADILRSRLRRLSATVNELLGLPGAKAFQTADGTLTLGEVKAGLEDLDQFKLSPLIVRICMTGLAKNPDSVVHYFQGKAAESALAQQEAASRIKVLTDAMELYQKSSNPAWARMEKDIPAQNEAPGRRTVEGATVIPQVSESFLDRLVALTNQSGDAKFRQKMIDKIAEEGMKVVDVQANAAYYRETLDRLKTGTAKDAAVARPDVKAQDAQAVEKKLAAIFDQLVTATDRLQTIYLEMSARNLNPSSMLYTVTEPATVRHSVSNIALLRQTAKIVALVAVLAALACLLHARLTGGKPQRGRFRPSRIGTQSASSNVQARQ